MSTIKTNTLSNVAGTLTIPVDTVVSGSAKAWVNFNGTGTVAIRGAFNVSSITDNGIGDYTVNFTTALPDVNYSITGFATNSNNTTPAGNLTYGNDFSPATSSVRVKTNVSGNYILTDANYVCVIVFR